MAERDIYEVANQLLGYVGPDTPEPLAKFLIREGEAASALADTIANLEADRAAQAERMARLEEALRKAMLWTDEENDVGSWREEAALALSKDNQHG